MVHRNYLFHISSSEKKSNFISFVVMVVAYITCGKVNQMSVIQNINTSPFLKENYNCCQLLSLLNSVTCSPQTWSRLSQILKTLGWGLEERWRLVLMTETYYPVQNICYVLLRKTTKKGKHELTYCWEKQQRKANMNRLGVLPEQLFHLYLSLPWACYSKQLSLCIFLPHSDD